MTTPITNRPLPVGYTLDYDERSWAIGHVFAWSEFYGEYLATSLCLSIKPGQNLQDAHFRQTGEYMDTNHEVFFVEGF